MNLLIKNTIATCILLLISSVTYSQYTIDDITTQKVNLEALKLVEKYQFYYDMRKGRDYDNFENLFVDENSEVNNDIMPDNNLNENIKIKDYLLLILNNYKKPMQVEIEPTEISSIRSYDNGKGEISVFVKKKISGDTSKNINYEDTFDAEIIIKFNLNENLYQIKKVLLTEELGKYFVIDSKIKTILGNAKSMANRDSLVINGNSVALDPSGLYIIKYLNESNEFVVESSDENVIGSSTISIDNIDKYERSERGDNNTRQIVFTKPLFYAEVGVSLNPFNLSPVKYTGDSKQYLLNNNFSYDISVDLGIHLNKNYNSKYNFYLKTGLHYKNLNFTADVNKYSYSTIEIDPDNYEYERTNSITNISEKINLSYLVVPIAFNTKLNYKKYILNFELGTQWHYSISADYSSTANAFYSGYYEDLYGITFAENGVYDFGTYDIEGNGELLPVKSLFSAYYSLGIGRKISKRTILNLSFMNNYGFSNMFEENTKSYSGNSEELNSITNISNEFRFSDIYLNLNLKYKF